MAGAAVLPYVLAGAGFLAQQKSASDAASERRSILNAQLDRDDATSKKTSQLVLDEAQKLSPQERAKALADNENQIYAQQNKDLISGAGGGDIGAVETNSGAGNVSDDFLRAKADRAVTEGNRLTSIARELAKTRSPGQVLTNEGYSRGNLSSELSKLGGANANYARAAQTDAAGVQEGSLGTFGKIASAIGMGMAAGGFGAAASPAASGAGAATSGSGIGFKVPSSLWGTA